MQGLDTLDQVFFRFQAYSKGKPKMLKKSHINIMCPSSGRFFSWINLSILCFHAGRFTGMEYFEVPTQKLELRDTDSKKTIQ